MKRCNKIKNTCGTTIYATCVSYETDLPEFSELEDCASIEETTEELYKFLGKVREQIDLSGLDDECLEYVLEEGEIVVKNVLLKHQEKICELESRIEQLENRKLCDIQISECGIDLDCLSLPCEANIVTFTDLINAVITKICEE